MGNPRPIMTLTAHTLARIHPRAHAHTYTHTHTHRPDDLEGTNCSESLFWVGERLEKAKKTIVNKIETLDSQLEQCIMARQGPSAVTPLFPPPCVVCAHARACARVLRWVYLNMLRCVCAHACARVSGWVSGGGWAGKRKSKVMTIS